MGGVSKNQFLSRRKDALLWLFPERTGLADFSKGRMPDTSLSPLSTPNTTFCDKYVIDIQGRSPYTSTSQKQCLIKSKKMPYDNRQALLFVLSVRIHLEPQHWMCDLAERLRND